MALAQPAHADERQLNTDLRQGSGPEHYKGVIKR